MSTCLRPVIASSVVVLVAALSAGCGGPPKVESAAGARLPADGAPGTASASTLPAKTIARDEWNRALGDRLKPSCDAREGVRTADASKLEGAGKVIGTWTEFTSQKGKSRTADGKKIGGGPEPTRVVDSIGMTCAAGASSLQVNGVKYPYDLAWVVSGNGKGKTLNGDDGAGQYAMIQALSFKDQRVIFAKVYVPSDANDDTDDTVIVSSLAGYLPDNVDEPIVRVVSDRKDPQMETFLFVKGTSDGISLRVPEQGALGRGRYLAVGKFSVAQ